MITNVYKTRIGKKAQITDTIIIGGIILAFIIYMWYAEINAPEVQQAYVGENQLAILQTAAKAEKALLFVDSAAKIAVDSAASQLSRQGGMYYFDSEVSPCNDYYGYNFWQVTENGVLKRCYPDDISSMMSSAVSESLANQFSKYPGQELNKYDIDYTFISEGDQIRGIAANPLEFDIVVEKKADITQKADEQKQEELKKSSSEVEAAVSKMIEEQTQKYYDTPYVIGGSDVETGIDCSGWVSYLVNYIRAQNGLDPISKGHGPIAEQWGSAKYTTMISESELRPGDIILLDRPYGGTGNWMTTSTWDHIAMVYKKGDQLWVSESSGGSHLKDTAYSEFIAYRKKQQEEKPGFNIGFARVNSLEEIFINGMTGSSGETSTGAGQGSSAQDTQSSSAVSGETFIVIDGRDDGSKNILYLISGGKIVHSYEVAIGENGMGKTKENDHKTPIGTYKIKWKASVFSDEDGGNKILPNKAFCGPGSIFTTDPNVGFKSESLWQPGYGGESAVVMGIDYPNSEDRAKGYTGSCIEIHASKLQTTGKDSAGCVRMNPPEARELYKAIEVGTKVIFERGPVDINEYLTSNAKSSQTQTLDAPKTATSTGINAYSQQSVNSGKGVPVLIYHAVKDGKPGETIISVEKFSEQMKYLNDEGYKTISITDLVNFMKTGAAVPEKAIVLTFDDGWISIKDVIPILNQYGFKASFWIFPGTGIGGPYMGWNDIIDISKNPNFEIGSHSMTHPWDKQDNLVTWVDGKTAGKTEKDAEQEIKESKRILEEKIGKDVKYFAWPVGWYNDKLISIAKDAGYQGLLTVEDGANYQGDDVFRIKRIFI
ncbi:MAG: polysaccharide deacetylase family protein, partial [Candidatus Woesearchaeota archaeon]|nr:polysaccharide deacetylase family protein [Candidatus Woesearchaeota archaeon]